MTNPYQPPTPDEPKPRRRLTPAQWALIIFIGLVLVRVLLKAVLGVDV